MSRRLRALPILLLSTGLVHAADPIAGDAKPPRFEGAIGLISSYGPEYSGAERSAWRVRPAGFLRYGRITISGAGGFTTRREDDVERGIAAELVQRRTWRLSLSGRWTNGRQEADSDALAGMGDIDGTVLARLRLQWLPEGPWRYSLAVSSDVLGHGGGSLGELGAARSWTLSPDTRLHFGAGLSFGSDTYMQSWYGVTPTQSQRSGYPVYTPGNGLRDVAAGLTLRHEFGKHWGSYVGGRASWEIGAAAKSPLVQQRLGWSLGAGLVWRF